MAGGTPFVLRGGYVSIEKMLMVDMVGHIDDLNIMSKRVVISGCLHPVNALQEIDTTNFTISTTENNLDALVDVCYIRPYVEEKDFTALSSTLKRIKNNECDFSRNISTEELVLDDNDLEKSINEVGNSIISLQDDLKTKTAEKDDTEKYIKYLSYLNKLDFSVDEFINLKNFHFDIYKVSKENMERIKENYENIPSIIFKIYEENGYNIVMAFTPILLKKETDRIFRSLNCEILEISSEFRGTPNSIVSNLKEKLIDINAEMSNLSERLHALEKENMRRIKILDKSLELVLKASEVKSSMACTNEFFYLCGWMPKESLKKFKDCLGEIADRTIIIEKNVDEIQNKGMVPPTRMNNNILVKPFESMVGMYGIPSYNELDPTTFLGISYMLMFGAMFGDLGQGLVFIVAGLLLKYKGKRPNFGGVISRLGIASSLFGVIYGSFFGFENVIPALVVRPMEDIQDILLFAVAFGCGLLIIGFIYSLINSIKKKDIENGVFGKNGLVGLIFYLSLLIFAITKVMNINTMPSSVWITIFIVFLGVMLFKEPITNIILKKKPLYSESKQDYFIEGGFGVIETLLSMFSNTVSFIRVGAFALNHVGLFVAFASLANMMKNSVGSAFMYVLGNLIIIGLEGLIVFIQGLRLEYYELFSKYYEGAGVVFNPVKLFDETSDVEVKIYKRIITSKLVNE
ncbi:MAG: V-type sodium synthase subunit [Clostridiaceae bacterium]|jgi:V/A-type H+-transporting ATPase subunit I|nr:V-type sodium synthase subunit [Clostridiaceae bacterium]